MVLHPTGKTQSSQDFRQARAATLLSQVDQILLSLKQKAAGWTGKNVPAAYHTGRANALQQAADLQAKAGNISPFTITPETFARVDTRALQALAQDTALKLNGAADSMADRSKHLIRATAQHDLDESKIRQILAGGLIEGTPQETIRTLRDEFSKVAQNGMVKVIDRNGDEINFEPAYYAKMVAITQTRQAVEAGRHQALRELGIDLVRIVGKISNNFCSAFLNQVFSLSGQSSKYPALSSLPGNGYGACPPFHPNCSKSTAPYIDDLASPEEADAATGIDDAQKLIGLTPSEAQRTYKDLQLRQQVTAVMESVTGTRIAGAEDQK
jgi:hypothetical protein